MIFPGCITRPLQTAGILIFWGGLYWLMYLSEPTHALARFLAALFVAYVIYLDLRDIWA